MGVPCSQFAIDALIRAGAKTVVANLHYLPKETSEGLISLDRGSKMSLFFSDETKKLLGSAGGIRQALSFFQGGGSSRFFILNADTICSLDLEELAQTHARLRQRSDVRVTLALLSREQSSSVGEESYREVLVDPARERVAGLGEKGTTGKMYVGCAILESSAVSHLEEGAIADFGESILLPAIRSQQVGYHLFRGEWMDVGSPRLWWQAHLKCLELLEKNEMPPHWAARIQERCMRLGPGVWVGKRAQLSSLPLEWKGPCFWNGEGSVPPRLGAGTVLYGNSLPGFDLSRAGIFASGHSIYF
jgi:NDP-sugar pyrophosphorylase family protein